MLLHLDPMQFGIFARNYNFYASDQRFTVLAELGQFPRRHMMGCTIACSMNELCNSYHYTASSLCELSYVVLQCVDALEYTDEPGTRFYVVN